MPPKPSDEPGYQSLGTRLYEGPMPRLQGQQMVLYYFVSEMFGPSVGVNWDLPSGTKTLSASARAMSEDDHPEQSDPHLVEAYRRAKDKGLIVEPGA